MQSSRFPSREQLMEMSITSLRNLDIQDQQEEALLQEVLNEKVRTSVIIEDIKTSDVPEIQTPEQEAEWQSILDQRRKEARVRMGIVDESTVVVEKTAEVKEEISEIEKEIEELKGERFCTYCTSKGKVHKKDCTRPIIEE
jgi:hypothetical protein